MKLKVRIELLGPCVGLEGGEVAACDLSPGQAQPGVVVEVTVDGHLHRGESPLFGLRRPFVSSGPEPTERTTPRIGPPWPTATRRSCLLVRAGDCSALSGDCVGPLSLTSAPWATPGGPEPGRGARYPPHARTSRAQPGRSCRRCRSQRSRGTSSGLRLGVLRLPACREREGGVLSARGWWSPP